MNTGPSMSEKIMKLVRRDPSMSLKELCKLVGLQSTSNVFYHIQRLEKKGLVHWTGSRAHINQSERAKKRHANGLIALRKMTKAEGRRMCMTSISANNRLCFLLFVNFLSNRSHSTNLS